jgi:hypothetical protein
MPACEPAEALLPLARVRPALQSVDAGSSLPIDNVNKLPGKSNKVVLQLPLLIDGELCFGVEAARALGFILVINVEFTGG